MNVTIDEIILLAGGAFLITWGVGKVAQRRKLLTSGVSVDGIVVENKYEGDKSGIYYPVVKYATRDQEWVIKKYDVGSSPPVYTEGDVVKVIYDQDDCSQFIINSTHSKFLGPAFIVVGVVLIVSVIAYFVQHQIS